MDSLNNCQRLDVQLCEAVKLHMLVAALQLFATSSCGGSVPLFAMIMFARQSSETPEQLMKNHLNVVGDTGGLEQVRSVNATPLNSCVTKNTADFVE